MKASTFLPFVTRSFSFSRESAEDRLEKLQAAMEEFCAKYGSWEPTQR